MKQFSSLTGLAAPLLRDNIDTDTIIPSREMRSTGRTGLADGLFAPWRYTEGRTPDPEFVLNRPEYANAPILAAGANFGAGSSREHAVWALDEWGIRAVIAESFAPIFQANALRNGLLTIALPRDAIDALAGSEVTIDLAAQTVTAPAGAWQFEIDAEARTMMLEGIDVIDLTLKSLPVIDAWTARDRAARPWIYLEPPQSSIGEGDRPKDGGGEPPQSPIGEGDHAKHGGGAAPGAPRPLPKPANSVRRARSLRRSMSLPENMLWQGLKENPGGYKFRRQHPAGPFVLDFYCASAKLCVEVDGISHEMGDRPTRDEARDAFLRDAGIATLRIPASEVLASKSEVIGRIVACAEARRPLHHPAGGPPPQSEIGEVR